MRLAIKLAPQRLMVRSAVIVLGTALSMAVISCDRQDEESPTELWGVQADGAVEIGTRLSMLSRVLGEERTFWVYLPESYSDATYSPRKYPVLYVLDGEMHFHTVAALVRYMSEGINGNRQIPELIVVGIINTNRTRDLSPTHSTRTLSGNEHAAFEPSGGGKRFLEFLETELIPIVEATYRIQPYRIFAGHSFGGLSAIQALLERPELFQGYISIDPSLWWDDEVMIMRAKEVLPEGDYANARIFISQAGYDVSDGPFDRTATWDKSFYRFTDVLAANEHTDLDFKHKIYGEEDHGSIPTMSMYDGLQYLFAGFKLNYADLYAGADSISKHFERVSSTLGFKYLPPERMIDQYASFVFDSLGETDKALKYLRLNALNYPDSPHAHQRLGEFYATLGKEELAEARFRTARKLRRAADHH